MSDRKTKLVTSECVCPGDFLCLEGGGIGTVVENEKRDENTVRLHYMIAGTGYHFDIAREPGKVHFPLVEILDLSA